MGIFNWFSRKKATKVNYSFDDEDRQRARLAKIEKSIRQERIDAMEEELKEIQERQREKILEDKLERAREYLDDLEGFDDEEEHMAAGPGMSIEDQLFSTLLSKMQTPKAAGPSGPQTTLPVQTVPKTSYTDEELRDMKARLPQEYVDRFKKIPEQMKVKVILDQLPDVDNETVKRAILVMEE